MTCDLLDEDFRTVGFTGAARQFPLSVSAKTVIAELNGVPVDKMPKAWGYAPNAYMRDWMEWLGNEKAAGRPIWNEDKTRVRMPS